MVTRGKGLRWMGGVSKGDKEAENINDNVSWSRG